MDNQNNLFGFEISPEAQQKIQDLLAKAANLVDKKPLAMEIYAIVEQLSGVGLDYFFIKPLKLAGIGGLKIKTVEVAMNMGKNAVLSIGKGILKAMSSEQLDVVLNLMRNSLVSRSKSED